jgi:hypothetical protein
MQLMEITNTGHTVAQVRLIMYIVLPDGFNPPPPRGLESFIAYVQRFDVISHLPIAQASISSRGPRPDPMTGMHALKRSLRSDGTRLGDIVPISQFRASAPLLPRHEANLKADSRLRKENSMEFLSDFWLNKYFEKDLYYALS